MFKTINHGWAIEVSLPWDATKSETVTVTEHLSHEDAESLAKGRLCERHWDEILIRIATYQALYGAYADYNVNYHGEVGDAC